MKPKFISVIILCLFVFSILFLPGCAPKIIDKQQVAKGEKIVIKFSHVVAENTPKGLAAIRFANLVRERTGGYVEVQVFPDSTLYKDGEEFDALRNGDVQMIAPATSKLSEMFPEWQLFDLPYAFPDLESVHAFANGSSGKELFAQLKRQDMIGLALWDNGFKQMTNNEHPLLLPKDFTGLNFRVMSSQVLQNQFAALGANAFPMRFNDVYEALKSGKVNAQENTISNIYTQKFDQVQKYLTISNHGYIGYVVIVNRKFWQSLPDRVRNILEGTMSEVTQWEQAKAEEVNESQLKELEQDQNLEIHEQTPQERKLWEEALDPIYDQLDEQIGHDLVKDIKQNRKW